MIYAEYNDNGVLTGVKLKKLTAESGDLFNESFDVHGSGFKALIWDANSMQPYSEVYLKTE